MFPDNMSSNPIKNRFHRSTTSNDTKLVYCPNQKTWSWWCPTEEPEAMELADYNSHGLFPLDYYSHSLFTFHRSIAIAYSRWIISSSTGMECINYCKKTSKK